MYSGWIVVAAELPWLKMPQCLSLEASDAQSEHALPLTAHPRKAYHAYLLHSTKCLSPHNLIN